jgi:pimeloyl-ACP methyl ester carboxylesterase
VRAHLKRTDIVTPALPGFAAPIPSGFDATKEAYLAWLVHEVEAVGEPVDIVGHDWGSLLVQRLVSTRPDLVHTWAAGSATIDRDYVWHDLAQMWQTPEVGEQIMDAMAGDALVDAIASPGLVLWGADDPYVTADFGKRLAECTGATLEIFPDSGHWWPLTKPVETAAALEQHWS